MGMKKKARQMGRERGKAAASWVFDGNTPMETYETFVRLYDNGDPAIEQFDTMTGWLSGEYADEPRPATLAADLGLPTETDEDMARLDEVCAVYEEAADAAYWAELERVARLQVGGAE